MAIASRWTDSIHKWIQDTIQDSPQFSEVTYELFITLRQTGQVTTPNSVQDVRPVATLMVMAPSPLLNHPPLVVVGDFPVTTQIQEVPLTTEIKKMLAHLVELQSRSIENGNVTQLFPPIINSADTNPLNGIPRIP
jgi:hypothetical protein